MTNIAIIEDDRLLAEMMQEEINLTSSYRCDYIFHNAKAYLQSGMNFHMILLDIVLPELSGLDAIGRILEIYPETSIIMNTIKDDSDTIFKALQMGAVGYIDKQSFTNNFPEVFKSVENGGAYMTPKIARKIIGFFQQSKSYFEELTSREMDIVNGILDGLSYKLIADRYSISINTVRTNIKRIYRKLEINSKSELFNLFNRL